MALMISDFVATTGLTSNPVILRSSSKSIKSRGSNMTQVRMPPSRERGSMILRRANCFDTSFSRFWSSAGLMAPVLEDRRGTLNCPEMANATLSSLTNPLLTSTSPRCPPSFVWISMAFSSCSSEMRRCSRRNPARRASGESFFIFFIITLL